MAEKTDEECLEAIRKFSAVTKCDEAFAHSILQDINFDLELALNQNFLDQQQPEKYYLTEVKHEQDEKQEKIRNKANDDNLLPELTFMTWNIDGIDTNGLQKRFLAVIHIIAKVNPEVIFLQEVVGDVMMKLIETFSNMYDITVSDPESPYFNVTLISKNIQILSEKIEKFSNTAMGRNMIVIKAKWKNLVLNLINTHLESMAEYSQQRRLQLSQCLSLMENISSKTDTNKTITIFSGDLNLRNQEVPPLSSNIKDAWVEDGAKKDMEFTWDMIRNDNKKAGKARLRFDRVYYTAPYRRVDFSLAGTQRIRGVSRFPSDHFAIVCRFSDAPPL